MAEEKPKAFVGFRVIEIPLAIVREMVYTGKGGPGATKLVYDTSRYDERTGISCDEFDGGLTIMRNADGTPKLLTKSKDDKGTEQPEAANLPEKKENPLDLSL